MGVDNYSYHRLLGEVRNGELPPGGSPWDWQRTVRAGAESGADVVALETCFIETPTDVLNYAEHIDPMVMISWGHPYGLEYATSHAAEADLVEWIGIAAGLTARRMRIVVAHPALRNHLWNSENRDRTVTALRRIAEHAGEAGLELAIENHADLTAQELRDIIEAVGAANLGVCFDIANALRVGDDPIEAAQILAPFVQVMHVKDVDTSQPFGLPGPPSVPLGTGSLPVREALQIIGAAQPDAWFMVEVAHIADPAADEEAWVHRDIDWIRSTIGVPGR